MQLNEEIWNIISSSPGIPNETKKTLHAQIMRVVELSKTSPAHKRLGVTVMTPEASLAGDKQASNRKEKPLAGDPKPKSI